MLCGVPQQGAANAEEGQRYQAMADDLKRCRDEMVVNTRARTRARSPNFMRPTLAIMGRVSPTRARQLNYVGYSPAAPSPAATPKKQRTPARSFMRSVRRYLNLLMQLQ